MDDIQKYIQEIKNVIFIKKIAGSYLVGLFNIML